MLSFIRETLIVAEGFILYTFARATGRPTQAQRCWDSCMADLDRSAGLR